MLPESLRPQGRKKMDKKNIIEKIEEQPLVGYSIEPPKMPKSTIIIGDNPGVQIGVDKKFNWFQKKMIKWCFGFKVKENK